MVLPPGAAAGVIPTNGGVLAWVGVPPPRFDREVRRDVEAAFGRLIHAAGPEVRDRLAALPRTSRFHSTRGWPGYLRQCAGPGWALVGDASHFKDPITAHGLTDAWRDAELLARAAHTGLTEPSRRDAAMVAAMANYRRRRDELSLPLLNVGDTLASFRWTMAEVRDHLRAMSDVMRDELQIILDFDEPGSTFLTGSASRLTSSA
jgi:2-polyprenyl-6-methoxyphenol hydroxylase-like FAD-dependent oxidoreductase